MPGNANQISSMYLILKQCLNRRTFEIKIFIKAHNQLIKKIKLIKHSLTKWLRLRPLFRLRFLFIKVFQEDKISIFVILGTLFYVFSWSWFRLSNNIYSKLVLKKYLCFLIDLMTKYCSWVVWNHPTMFCFKTDKDLCQCQYKSPENIWKTSHSTLTKSYSQPSLLSSPGHPSFSGVLISPVAPKAIGRICVHHI